jgi:hypothetical protein
MMRSLDCSLIASDLDYQFRSPTTRLKHDHISVEDGGQDIQGNPETTLVWPPTPTVKQSRTSSKEIQIAVTPANQLPIITMPGVSKTVDEETDLIIGGIRIDDRDSRSLTVTLSVNHGTLAVKTNVSKGLTESSIRDNKTKTVTLLGDLAQIKATLADPQAITYRGDKDFKSNDSLTIKIDDTGRGKTDKLDIVVLNVNDPPVLKISEKTDIPQAPSETESPNPVKINQFSPQFPQKTCGDPATGNPNTVWYPVWIDDKSVDEVSSTYCRDAQFRPSREKTGRPSVQVASFTNLQRAEEFARQVGGEVGEPHTLDSSSE